ncbi:MAG: ATP-binding protein, partial [Candidatus Binatia bacterium]
RIPGLPEPRRGDPETERWCLFEAAVSLVTTASTVAPVLLVLDDLHWAGKPALLLLRHLVRSPDPAALLVVVTYRDTDLGRTHPLTEVMADLRREAGVERVPLRGLDGEGVRAMVEAAAGMSLAEPGRALAAVIARETEGNPFFVQEILRHLVETGALRRGADGQWMSDLEVHQLAIPEGIREVVGRRLSRLSETANHVLAAAAVVGREVDVGVLEALGEAPSEAVLDALDEACRARLLVENDARPGRFAFSHAVVRQTLLEELGTTRRVRLHLKIGEAIEQVAGQRMDEHLRALAHHFGEAAIAGGAARAVKYSRMAGVQAIASAAWEEAASYYERALGALELDGALLEDAQEELRCDLLVALADAQVHVYESHTVRSTARRAYDIARRLRDPVRLARAARSYGFGTFSFGVADTTLLAMLDEALDGLGPDEHSLRAALLDRKVMYFDTSGSGTDTRPIATEALAVATNGGVSNAIRLAHVARCRSLGGTADLAGYLEAANGVASLSGTVGANLFSDAAFFRAQAAVRRGDSAEFSRHRQVLRDLTEKFRLPAGRALVAQWDAAEALWRGRFEDARRLTRLIEDLVRGDPSFRASAHDQRAVARIETGRGRELIADHEALVMAFPSFAYTRAVLAMLRAESGDVDGAREAFEVLASDGFTGLPHGFSRPATLHRLAETCTLLGDAERAAQLYDILLPYAGQLLIS